MTVGLSSNDATEGTVLPASLTFTSANWNAAQTVTVTGVNDDLDDGDVAYSIVTAAAPARTSITTASTAESVTNTDNDTAGFTVSHQRPHDRGWRHGDVTVVLDAQPTADVTIGLSASDATRAPCAR